VQDIRLKKLVVALTVTILLAMWWNHHPHTIQATTSETAFRYIMQRPGWGAGEGQPLIVALHGNGDTIHNFRKTLFDDLAVDARIIFVQGPYTYRNGYAWPRSGSELKRYGDALAEVVETLSQKYPAATRPILIGFSGGGCMAYYLAASYPDRYSTVIPVSGSLDSSVVRETAPPDDAAEVVAMHGTSDPLIGYAAGLGAVDQLLALGMTARMVDMEFSRPDTTFSRKSWQQPWRDEASAALFTGSPHSPYFRKS
jgi:predicted esterase